MLKPFISSLRQSKLRHYIVDVSGGPADSLERGLDFSRAMLRAGAANYIRLVASKDVEGVVSPDDRDTVVVEMFRDVEGRNIWGHGAVRRMPCVEGSRQHRQMLIDLRDEWGLQDGFVRRYALQHGFAPRKLRETQGTAQAYDYQTGEALGPATASQYEQYMEEVASSVTPDVGAVDGTPYGYIGRTVYMLQ